MSKIGQNSVKKIAIFAIILPWMVNYGPERSFLLMFSVKDDLVKVSWELDARKCQNQHTPPYFDQLSERHQPLWSHFVSNVHYMPAYVAHENITLWILYSGNRMQVRFPQATTVTIKQNFKKQACTKKHTTRPSILLNCRKTMVPMGKHFLIDNRQKTNF